MPIEVLWWLFVLLAVPFQWSLAAALPGASITAQMLVHATACETFSRTVEMHAIGSAALLC